MNYKILYIHHQPRAHVIKLSDRQPVFGYLRVDIEKFIATEYD